MLSAVSAANRCLVIALTAFVIPIPGLPAERMPPQQQNALVQKYCAVCHTDAAKNGGLTLEHYDAGYSDPALAAMLLSKLQNAAMGAAGLGIPDKATRDAWVEATAAQAERAKEWTVTRAEVPGSHLPVLTASIVREVTPRASQVGSPVYRLAIGCNIASHQGQIQLTWSPQPQTGRTFFVSADGTAGIPHQLEGREKMGNGAAVTSGLAGATLKAPLALQTLTINDLFPGETVVFPLSDLDQSTRRQLAVCFPVAAANHGGQQPATPAVFTAAQAEAGRTAYENSCGKCHTYTLLGRTGEDGELPPVTTLSIPYQKFVGTPNHVPPLAGKVFLSRWGQKTAAELIARFQITASDPFFQFEGMNDDTTVNITAYVLQVNGARPGTQPLTRTTSVVVNSLVE